jgi:hypothetical protein
MEMFRKVILTIYVISFILAAIALSDGDFRAFRYGRPEQVIPWLFMFFSSAISIYFIGFYEKKAEIKDNVISLWLKRKKLEEKKRISELEK